ncbi:MAG: ABC transporter permease [Rothia sp. (in: high G+C Gram-positive bacteria)]|uniref:ABC transporter permease n=1 Tax=Rothia sp. (in: high G+C Gram-positive bacteria) TaxID=1885016 RepID=UPI00270CB09A|nr:ABC transporter permease [Rothia sp. (in: high G+C Gram-positive bacteria)]
MSNYSRGSLELSSQYSHYQGLVTRGQLRPVGVRGNYRLYFQRLWKYRAFIWHQSLYKVFASNSDNRLGSLWLFLRPLMDVMFYWVLFGLVLRADRGMENFPAFLIVGILMFQFTAQSITSAASVMKQSKSLIQGFNFPRVLPPVALALKNTLEALPMIAVMLVGIIVIPPHVTVSWTWILVVPIFLLQVLFNTGLILLIARIGYFIPDTTALFSFVTRILMFGSGVIFPIERFIHHPTALLVIESNPLFMVLNMYREVLIEGAVPSVYEWLLMVLWVILLLLVGFVFFVDAEERYGSVS